ncbi:little elongation complex subunit 2 [Paramisgurnus dabryanus]|uniref:little elongation complex subunit 2 n=1 Tax=Paramisgurnus dabryanus TaxID=90735 RepID=UPI0031F39323
MELKWDDPPVTGPVVFSRDVFDKFTLAPTIKELYAFVQSPDVKPEETCDNNPEVTSSQPKSANCEKEDPQNSSSNRNGSVEPMPDIKQSQNDDKPKPVKTNESTAFPEPVVPYPCYSTLHARQRRFYLNMLKNKNFSKATQLLLERVSNEVSEFMKYLQDVSRKCADAYNYIPPGGIRYCEEYFTASLEHMKGYPQSYSIQEMTSLTGGKFVSELSLNFEKQLLAMGKIDMVEKKVMPEHTLLAGDYETVSSVIPPAKKASALHTPISSDNNAEKLSATYEPHVCLSKEAFLQLVNNDPEFTDAWELPVWVKMNTTRGSGQSKTAYIDPPLLKTEMSLRDRNLMFHEESVKLAIRKTVTRPIFFLTSENLSFGKDPPPEEKMSRSVVAFDNAAMDFETDFTDLESFGESCKTTAKVKAQNEPKTAFVPIQLMPKETHSSPKKPTSSLNPSVGRSTSQDGPKEPLNTTPTEVQSEADVSSADGGSSVLDESVASEEELVKKEKLEALVSGQFQPTKKLRRMINQDSDSDEDKLVIDQFASPKTQGIAQETPEVPSPQALDLSRATTENHLGKVIKKGIKRQRISGECDQLGQILRMQDAMMKATPGKNQETQKVPVTEDKPTEQKTYSLVKPCVTSYLESREGQGEETTASTAVPVLASAQKKRLLKEDLQVSAEDELDFDPPAEGSVLYKLYSLQDILLMVRSSVPIAHPRHDRGNFRAVPVHVLPKLEYQLCYGAESLTHPEACQLWAEKLLHSSTASFISRINAHTSEVAEIQELQADWMQSITCNFKPARCLNILYHLLKKVSTLQEGRYLLVHKPREGFVTIFKSTDESKTHRSVYHLQAVHSGPPAVAPGIPWVSLDPWHILPYHQYNHRPPCTFPPRPVFQANAQKGPIKYRNNMTGAANPNKKSKKKKKQKINHKNRMWQEKMRVKLMNDTKKQTNL